MLEETFANGNSLLHRMDARCKLFAAVLFAALTALLHTWQAALSALLLAALLVVIARLPIKQCIHRILLVNIFIAFLWLFLPFSTEGDIAFTLGPLVGTYQGIHLAMLITIKSNAIVWAFIALATTSTITTCGQAMRALYVPQKISLLFLFTWRYLHVILQEYQRLHTAAKIRGFIPRTAMHTYRTYANLIGMVLVKSWDRAERVDKAMRLRGFNGTFHTLSLPQSTRQDIVRTGLFCLCILAIAGYDISQHFGVW